MKNSLNSNRLRLSRIAVGLLILITSAQFAQSAITVHFVEEANGVRISFNGSINLDNSSSNTSSLTSESSSNINRSLSRLFSSGEGRTGSFGGSSFLVSAWPASAGNFSGASPGDESQGMFGIRNNNLLWSAAHVSGGTFDSPSQLTVTPSNASFLALGSNIDAEYFSLDEIAEGTVLWAAGGSATSPDNVIIFSKMPIPEPSNILLLSFSSLIILKRKRS